MITHAHYDCPHHGTIALTWETTDTWIGPARCVAPIPFSILQPVKYDGLCGAIVVRTTHDTEPEPKEN